jgi:hypothetical protein
MEYLYVADDSHLSDRELLLAVDGELSAGDAKRAELHLAACWACRVRRQELETAIGDFVRLHRESFNSSIPPPEGPRALLKAQLGQISEAQPRFRLNWTFAAAAILTLAAAVAILVFRNVSERNAAGSIAVSVPNPSLTPGATVRLSQGELCRETSANNKLVSPALQRKVFDEYGLRSSEPGLYEVDYLITPALGGADDIHNLWPQSNTATVWNARVKDELESRLRDLVCDGQVDLATAQQEIATNWIDAYKKYFHTDRPLTGVR